MSEDERALTILIFQTRRERERWKIRKREKIEIRRRKRGKR